MAEEVVEPKLAEANKHFVNKNYTEVLKILSGCPQSDVKVKNNTVITNYLKEGGVAKDVMAALEAIPTSITPAVGPTVAPATVFSEMLDEFLYDGHEAAYFNSAVVALHNGFVEKSVGIFRALCGRVPAVNAEIQVRAAFLLQVATAPFNKKKIRTDADEELVRKVFAANLGLIQGNATLKKMFQLAFCENSNLHDWFAESDKSNAQKITYYNDLGALAMNDGKENLASVYFANALKAYSAEVGANVLEKEIPNDLTLHSILYNTGVCALLRKEYGAAVKALLLTQSSMKGSPLLWLRVAQAALGVHAQYNNSAISAAYAAGQDAISKELSKGSEDVPAASASPTGAPDKNFPTIVANTLDKNSGRLLPNFQLLQIPSTLGLYGNNTDQASRTALDTAMKAIDNGLGILIPADTQLAVAADQLVLSGNTSLFRALQYLLCYSAFVELQRMNYAVVASIVTDLLSLGKGGHPLQPDVLVTAVIYASEALCHLNKPNAALKILQSVSGGDFIISEGNIEDQKIRVASLMINLAMVHIANANWKTASTLTNNLISKFNATPAPTTASATSATASIASIAAAFNQTPSLGVVANQTGGSQWHHVGRCATLLQIFIELAQGNRDRALEILSIQPVAPPLV